MFAILAVFLVGFVAFAIADDDNGTDSNGSVKIEDNKTFNKTEIKTSIKEKKDELKDSLEQLREMRDRQNRIQNKAKELKREIKDYMMDRKELIAEIKGKNITFEREDNKSDELRIRSGNHTVKTRFNITEEVGENNETIIKFENGNFSREIKVMPDTASEMALQRLRMRVCNESNNCTIELKDVGADKARKIAYELQVERHYKILGIFNAKVQERAEVNAETGEVTSSAKPWWNSLASVQD